MACTIIEAFLTTLKIQIYLWSYSIAELREKGDQNRQYCTANCTCSEGLQVTYFSNFSQRIAVDLDVFTTM